MNRAIKQPTAKRLSSTPGVQTVYLVQWPSTAHNAGKSYYVTPYPDSDLVFVETVLKRRPVSPLVGRRIMPAIREAIAALQERST
jgi:hypothetical protein